MMIKTSVGLALIGLAAIAGGAAPAQAQEVKPVCTDASRACLLRTTKLYLDGLAHHDASAIPFAPNVRCTEQGDIPVTDEKKFRSEINNSTLITGIRNVRMMADAQTQSVAAFYILDVAATGAEPPYTVRRGERFKIVGGLITEVEVFNYIDLKLRRLADPLWPD